MLNYALLDLNSPLVAVLLVVGIVVLVSIITLLGVKLVKSKNKEEKEEEKKTKKETKPVEKPAPKTEEEIAKEKEEKAQKREESRKQQVSNHIKKVSELGIARTSECYVELDPNGVEAVGIVFNKSSKVYMFGPKDYKLNIGDVVIVKDLSGAERMVPVVVPNRTVNENDLVKPFKDIERVVYQTEQHIEYTAVKKEEPVEETPVEEPVQEEVVEEVVEDEVVEEAVEEPVQEEVVEAPVVEEVKTFVVTFDTLGKAEAPEAITDVTEIPTELPLVKADGFEFNGWALAEGSTEAVELGSKLEADVTLFAMWEEVPAVVEEVVEEPQEEVPAEEPAEEVEDEADDAAEEKESETEVVYNAETNTYTVIRKKKSFEGRICVASKENKEFYNQVKNRLLSYGLTSRISKTGEKFRLKRELYAQIKFTAKQLVIYLALDPKQFVDTKYKGKDLSEKKTYQGIPFQYKTRTERKTKWMLELIDKLAEQHNLAKNEAYKDEDFAKAYPFMSEEELVEKGYLVITEKTVTEVVEEPEEENSEE